MALNKYDESVRRLAAGFTDEFAEFCAGHEKMHELMMDLAGEFVEQEIPVVHDDAQIDVASELLLSVTVRPV